MNEPIVSRDRVDILKAFAIIAVIFIHVVSVALQFVEPLTKSWFNLISFDQVLRFCVPVFIALSGFGLAAKFSSSKLDLKDFYLRRVTKLLPQYLFWAVTIYFVLHVLALYTGEVVRYGFFESILLGRADYHLYFVPLIFQFYVLFPVLFFFSQRHSLLVLLTSFILQVFVFYLVGTKTENSIYNEVWNDQRQYIFFGSWLFYFVLGMWIGQVKSFSRISVYAKKVYVAILAFVILIAGLYWSISNSTALAKSGVDLQAVTRFTRLPVLVYSMGLIVFSLLVFNSLKFLKASPLRKMFLQLGRNSYTTYLLHTLVLRLFVLFIPELLTQNILLFGVLVTLVSLVSSEAFNRLVKYGQYIIR